jgi:7-cyano-7-deazaguanine reductase
MSEGKDTLKALGSEATRYAYDDPRPDLLERFVSPAADAGANPAGAALALRIDIPEFSCLCPITAQPDWARIVIRYQPDRWCVESKSLKLYMGSFRNAGVFHEGVVNRICNELVALLEPHWLVVEGRFTARGGIPFWPVSVDRRSAGADTPPGDGFDTLAPLTERLGGGGGREEVI